MCSTEVFDNKRVDASIFESLKAIASIVSPIFIVNHINNLDLLYVGNEDSKDACIWFNRIDRQFYYSVMR
ncbi:hypothetical protein [Anaerotignum propionicum]|uniref:hypothetical protein n=1 Tax=Anaerotignum propionicum TaxID=28446 RepID=UPI002896ADDC|nr:hypothetical protein [Anaerotignum propionicum]